MVLMFNLRFALYLVDSFNKFNPINFSETVDHLAIN